MLNTELSFKKQKCKKKTQKKPISTNISSIFNQVSERPGHGWSVAPGVQRMKTQWLLVDSACHPRDRERLGSSGSNNKMQPGSPRRLGHWAVGSACFTFTGRSRDPRAHGHLPCEPPAPAPAYGSDLPLPQDLSSAFSPAIRKEPLLRKHPRNSCHSPLPRSVLAVPSQAPFSLGQCLLGQCLLPEPLSVRTRSCPSFG